MLSILTAILFNISLLTGSPATRNGNVSVLVKDLSDGTVIEQFQPQKAVTPASVTKLLTTAAALEVLGENFRFSTKVMYSGEIIDSTLYGDLVILGNVDPTLGAPDKKIPLEQSAAALTQEWAARLRRNGIKSVNGRIVADMSLLSDEGYNPYWLEEDIGNYYAPGVWGLNYRRNTLEIYLMSGECGSDAVVLRTVPEVKGLETSSTVICTRTSRDLAYVGGKAMGDSRVLRGEIPSGKGEFRVKGDLPNPGLQLATDLRTAIEAAGGTVSGQPQYVLKSAAADMPLKTVFVHRSQPLREIIKVTNWESNNLYAEALARYLASRHHAHSTSQQAARYIYNYWYNRHMPMKGCVLRDGCGLAPQNKLSAEMLVHLLSRMYRSKHRKAWYNSLPVSGKSGTLTHFLENTPLEGKVHAKSGTITGTKTYAGYIRRPDGHIWVFAVMVSDTGGASDPIQKAIEKYLLSLN